MNDREKMLADLRRVLELDSKYLRVADDQKPRVDRDFDNASAAFFGRHGEALEALLTEPTLEEVLAELAEYGEPRISYNEDDSGWDCWMASSDCGACSTFADTPLQAARECLRRVKE